MPPEFWPKLVPGGSVALEIWLELRREAGGGWGPAPVRRQDVSEELDASEIYGPVERRQLRHLVRCLDEGYEQGKAKPDKQEAKKQEAKKGEDTLLHFRREFRKAKP